MLETPWKGWRRHWLCTMLDTQSVPGGQIDMPEFINNRVIDDAVAEAMQLDLSFLCGPGLSRHVPFALTPAEIGRSDASLLQVVAPLLGRLTQALSRRPELIQELHAPLAAGDPFFAELLSIHRELHCSGSELPRLPLLVQRSDFMIDMDMGPRLVECNSIAAGMGPFGNQIQRLHAYMLDRWPQYMQEYSTPASGSLIANPATQNLAGAIVSAAQDVRTEHGDGGAPTFLMVVQEDEDNIFDQRLLERALQDRGVRTFRRTFRQLLEQLRTGPNQRLLLKDLAAIDVVYLRAGYQYRDYIATDLDTRRCCDALRATRIIIERHRVAVNATVAQQLATSKRMQQYLANASADVYQNLGFSSDEAQALGAVFSEMRGVDSDSVDRLYADGDVDNWVLKNQGEGGGHCLFGPDIATRLESMPIAQFPAWSLMRRLRPRGRDVPTLAIREGSGQQVDGLISEIGFFTAHLEDRPLPVLSDPASGYLGYLVRSKPPDVAEGGVHSGMGMLDSLRLSD